MTISVRFQAVPLAQQLVRRLRFGQQLGIGEHAQAGVMRRTLGAFHLASGRAALEEGHSEALAKGARAWVASRERP